ncbi:glycoside hydrolase family protein, partial [Burkholderia ambifaria]
MANENMRLSQAGWAALRQRENVIMAYYNDQANNCTYGVGTLVHAGPCTPQELARPVSAAQVNAQLAARVSTAEAAVRRAVSNRDLTQAQFDELVSYTYNAGNTGAQTALRAANQSNDAG